MKKYKVVSLFVFSCCCLLIFTAGASAKSENLQIYISEYPPLCFTKDGKVTGIATEIVKEMMKSMNVSYAISSLPWKRAYKYLLEEPDVMLFTVERNDRREKLFKWVGPLMTTKVVFFARKDSEIVINKLDDAKKVRAIGIVSGYATEKFLLDKGFTNLDAITGTEGGNPQKLMHDRIDLWATNDLIGIYTAKLRGVDPKNMKIVYTLSESTKYMAFSKQTSDLTVQKWHAALDEIKKNGIYEEIYSRWMKSLLSVNGGTHKRGRQTMICD